jgi:TolA-binding protein
LGGYADVSEAKLDSLSFEVAQELYLNNDCEKALPLFTSYINKYTEGFFLLYAHYYRADCLFSNNAGNDALADYEYVIQAAKNSFTETALLNVSYILVNQEKCEEALPYLQRLETEAEIKQNLQFARKALIKCYEQTKNAAELIGVAEKYVVNEKISPEEKRWALMLMAKAYETLGDTAQAMVQYKIVSAEQETSEGAEAKYALVNYYFTTGDYEQCEKEIIDFLEKNTPYQYWLGKSYITWAQLLINRNEIFQARYTLQTVLQYYTKTDDGIVDTANDMLNAIADMETEKNEEPEVVVPMGDNQELFE